MTFVVTESCIRCQYTDCVEVCPVDCFHEAPNMLVINPDECIDCNLCFAELGSSALQRIWYRRTGGKRLFTMAPIHHGLQTTGGIFRPGKKEWHEATIVTRAWIVAAVCAMASLALLKVR